MVDNVYLGNEELSIEFITLYYEKLQYAVYNADDLIKSAFDDRFYSFYGVDRSLVNSPAQMCSELYFHSFVMTSEDQIISSCLTNERFMFGHFIPASNEPSAVHARAFGECREGQVPRSSAAQQA